MLRICQQRRGVLMGSMITTRRSLSLPSSSKPPQLQQYQRPKRVSLVVANRKRPLSSVQATSSATSKARCSSHSNSSSNNNAAAPDHLRNISSTRTASKSTAEAAWLAQQQQGGQQQALSSCSSSSAASTTVPTAVAATAPSSSPSGITTVLDTLRTFSVATFWSPTTKQAAILALPVIGNVSYIAISSGFLMTDMLQLRLLLIGGYTGLVGFHSLHQRPLMIPLRWSAVFVALNMLGAAMLMMDRFAPTLNDVPGFERDGEALYERHFASYLTRGQFHQLLALARRERVPPGTVLTKENQPSESVYFLVSGRAHVYHGTLQRTPTRMIRSMTRRMQSSSSSQSGGSSMNANVDADGGDEMEMTLTPTATTNIATIEQGGFVNDVAFQLSSHDLDGGGGARSSSSAHNGAGMVGAYGTVVTVGEEDCDVMVWDVAALRNHLKAKPDMERNIRFCLSDHLVKSLLRQRAAAHQREQQQQQRHQQLQQQQQ